MRSVEEWVGRTDDAMPPESVKRRILERQERRCPLTGEAFGPSVKPEFDHITPLWLGGKNCESNLQALAPKAHAGKTKAEATVRAKINRQIGKHFGTKKQSSRPIPGSKASGLRKRMDGTVERREPHRLWHTPETIMEDRDVD